MKLSAEQIEGITVLREKLQERLEQLYQEINMTKLNIDALDAALTKSSFTRASDYDVKPDDHTPDVQSSVAPPPEPAAIPDTTPPQTPTQETPPQETPPPQTAPQETPTQETQHNPNAVPIMVNDAEIGGIITEPDKISIAVYVPVSVETQPFKTFFLSRIIGGMEKKDADEVAAGNLSKDLAIRYELKTQNDTLNEIVVHNYRLEERAREIASTIRWALSRMLENHEQ